MREPASSTDVVTRADRLAPAHYSVLRRRKGISLDEISEQTKIPVPVLQDLEAERFDRLPPGIYARAYVRAYAGAAGLDPEAILAHVMPRLPGDESLQHVEEIVKAQHDNEGARALRPVAPLRQQVRWAAMVALPLLAILLFVNEQHENGPDEDRALSRAARNTASAMGGSTSTLFPSSPAQVQDLPQTTPLEPIGTSGGVDLAPEEDRPVLTKDVELKPRKAVKRKLSRQSAPGPKESDEPVKRFFKKIGRGFKKIFGGGEDRGKSPSQRR
ncbi:MAG: helix-turn-helix domain-containing protein [Acidobacteria bacterium]|nr:helix-turn-helix domain-containing protein [Acidobacteriota bacterium]